MMLRYNESKPSLEVEINGKKIPYDACGFGDLEECKKSYQHFQYIGSGTVYYVNGIRNEEKELHHYFIKNF